LSWASASLLHLSPDEATAAMREVRRVLGSDGVFHLSLRSGDGALRAGPRSSRRGEPRG
jgi:hypothetical protein